MWTENISKSLIYLVTSFESFFIRLQSILLWEQPYYSAFVFVLFNCVYWLVASWTRRIYSIIFLMSAITISIRFWCSYIWPEISVPPPPDADPEEWTPVHSQALSAPEINFYLKELSMRLESTFIWFIDLRRRSSGVFCVIIVTFLSVFAVIGSIIPGVVVVYLIMMTIALGPGLGLYLVPDSWFQYLKTYLTTAKNNKEKDENEKLKSDNEYQLTNNALNETLAFIDNVNEVNNEENLKQIKINYSLDEILGFKEENKNTSDHSDRSSRESSVSSILNFVPTYFNGSSATSTAASIITSLAQSITSVGGGDNEDDDEKAANDFDIDEFEIVNESDILADINDDKQKHMSGNKDGDDNYLESAL